MASSVNYNSVWTSIFEPLSTFGFLERYGRLSESTKRHDLPYHHRLRPGGRRAAHRPRRERLEPGRRGRRALPQRRAGVERRPQRHDARPRAAHLGAFETNFGGLAEIAPRLSPTSWMPKPDHLGWERPPLWSGELHRLPPAGLAQRRRRMKRGDNVLICASGGLGSYATQSRAGRRRQLICVASPRGRPTSAGPWARRSGHRDRKRRGPSKFWKDERTQDPSVVRKALRRSASAEFTGGGGHRHRASRHGRERPSAPRSTSPARAAPSPPAPRTLGLRARVRQPLPVDVAEAHHRLALRQLPRGAGGQPPDRQGQDPHADALQGLLHRRTVGQAAYDVHRNLHPGQGRRLRSPRGPGRARPREARPASIGVPSSASRSV